MEIYGHIKNYEEDELLSYSRYFPYKYVTTSPKNKTHLLESLLGLKLLQDLLRNTDSIITLHDLRYHLNGQPYFPGNNLFCSFAHSNGISICCLEKNPVGVDLENLTIPNKTVPLTLLHPDLLNLVGQKDWIRAWVHQEAVFKCLGRASLEEVLKIQWHSPYLGFVPGDADTQDIPFNIRPFDAIPHHYAAICSSLPF